MTDDIIELLQRTIDHEDPDRQYIGYLAKKIEEYYAPIIKKAVKKARVEETYYFANEGLKYITTDKQKLFERIAEIEGAK